LAYMLAARYFKRHSSPKEVAAADIRHKAA